MMTISELQKHVRELKAAQGWADESVNRRVVYLVSEVGEMTKELLKLTYASADTDVTTIKAALGMEIYDIIWNPCDLANLAGIDLDAAFAKKEAINRQRKWESGVVN